ncbi:MAG: uracil-DNA glycosylase [Candidatus Omnitrophica bacterium]|nr:uracil-DNA glycosylase [Candidatus Omnitrophota bacterium]
MRKNPEDMKNKENQLEQLKQVMMKKDLPLKKTAHHIVFGEGSANAPVFFIGEAPGKQEDLKGLPFVGAAGKILNQLLQSIKLNREDVYITSILKYRPPNNRNPTIQEIVSHAPYLIKQIEIIQPQILVTLGNFSTKFVLSQFNIPQMQAISGISQLHGQPKKIKFDHYSFVVVPMYHPAAALYNSSLRKVLQEDFLVIKNQLQY